MSVSTIENQRLAAYIFFEPDEPTVLEGNCAVCQDTLEHPPAEANDQVVMHENGGDKHPIHLECAKQVHKVISIKNSCPHRCGIQCDPATLYSNREWVQQRVYTLITSCVSGFIQYAMFVTLIALPYIANYSYKSMHCVVDEGYEMDLLLAFTVITGLGMFFRKFVDDNEDTHTARWPLAFPQV